MQQAIAKYVEFHQLEPNEIGEFPSSFRIPTEAGVAGPALFVLYRSGKRDPLTRIVPDKPVDYIHEHEKGVKLYLPDETEEPVKKVPQWITRIKSLTRLGDCLGFGFLQDGVEIEAEGTKPLPELYTIPSGKALLVIQGKRKVLALIWGGKLRVESRGIVG